MLFANLAVAADFPIEVAHLDGTITRGELVFLFPELILTNDSGESKFAWTEILSVKNLVPAATSAPAERPPLRFELADGSIFGGKVVSPDGGPLAIQLRDGQFARLDLPAVRCIIAPTVSENASRKLADLLKPPAGPTESTSDSADVAIVARGSDVLELRGAVKQINAERIVFHWNDREVPLPWDRIAGLFFARPLNRSSVNLIRMADGDIFSGRIVGGNADSLTLQSPAFEKLILPWSAIEQVDARSEKMVFLSDVKERRYDYEPFFDRMWPFTRDLSLSGQPIRLGGQTYRKGICMRSRAALSFPVGGEYRQFVARVGILDEMGSRGCAALRVLGDGRELWSAAGVRGGQPPRDIAVPIEGVQELTLVVDFDEELDLSDQVAWAFARLIK